MEFHLEQKGCRYTDAELIDDLRRVAEIVGRSYVSRSDYEAHGKFNRGTISKRFGSWRTAHKRAGLECDANDAATGEQLIDDLRQVAKKLNHTFVSLPEYRKYGRWSERPFYRVFGSWIKALEAAGLEQHPQAYSRISDAEYFSNIEDIWRKLGRQPHYGEVEKPFSRYSAGAYEGRFGTWRKALEAFIEYIEHPGQESPNDDSEPAAVPRVRAPSKYPFEIPTPKRRRTPRNPSLRLRFLIMRRDRFRCCNCGRSPAGHPGLELHIDHIEPWSEGGETELSNLQTLCADCNLGKGKLSINEIGG